MIFSGQVPPIQQPQSVSQNDQSAKINNRNNKFYFEKYYEKKLQAKNKLDEEKKEALKLDKTLKLDINEIKPMEKILLSLKNGFSKEAFSCVDVVQQYLSTKIWLIKFTDDKFYDIYKDKSISIDGVNHKLIDANETSQKENDKMKVTLTGVIRLHWLPPNFSLDKINNHLLNEFGATNATILSTIEEKVPLEGMNHIKNGVKRIKIKYDINLHTKIINLIGIHYVCGHKCLFQLSGYPPKCLYCNQFGHLVKLCPKKSLKCSKCNKNGHTDDECNWSKRLQITQISQEDLQMDDIQNDTTLNNNNLINAINLNNNNDERDSDNALNWLAGGFTFAADSPNAL